MRDNTMTEKGYVYETISWSVILFFAYKIFLFRPVGGTSAATSYTYLIILICALLLTGLSLTWHEGRNNINVWVNILLPFEIYTAIAYYRNMPFIVWIVFIAAVSLSVLYTVSILKRRIAPQKRKDLVIIKRLFRSLLESRAIITCCMAFMLLYLGIIVFFGISPYAPSVNADCFEYISSEDALDTVLHESRHAWQHRLIDLYDNCPDELKSLNIFFNAGYYKQEIENYVPASGDYNDYYYQNIEIDARSYAYHAANEYLTEIEWHLNINAE